MPTRFERELLYEMIWDEPLRTLATKVGVSDTAIRKACKKANIPLPPQGHWAKKRAGKKSPKIELPLRFPGASNTITFGGHSHDCTPVTLDTEIPPVPSFFEGLNDLRARVQKMIGKVTCQRKMTKVHPIINKLLNQDEERRNEFENYPTSIYAARFESSIEKRRLRILNAIFFAIQRVGCRPSMSTSKYAENYDKAYVAVGNQHVAFILKVNKASKTPHLELFIERYHDENNRIHHWVENREFRIEDNLTDIVVELIMTGEYQYRCGLSSERKWIIEKKAELEEKEQQRKLEQKRQVEIERKRREQEKIDSLLKQADAFHKAETIRNYVSIIRNKTSEIDADPAQIEEWSNWALAQAERIDPTLNNSFLLTDRDKSE